MFVEIGGRDRIVNQDETKGNQWVRGGKIRFGDFVFLERYEWRLRSLGSSHRPRPNTIRRERQSNQNLSRRSETDRLGLDRRRSEPNR